MMEIHPQGQTTSNARRDFPVYEAAEHRGECLALRNADDPRLKIDHICT